MRLLQRLRSLVALRTRLRGRRRAKHASELSWWLAHWDPVLREGGFNPGDAAEFLDPGETVGATYLERRRQQARAEVRRVVQEAGLGEESFFHGKVVVDIGPGPLGFPDACPARISVGIEPLAERFARAGLLLPDSPALYLATGAERIPLLAGSADVVLARNSLDHVDDPEQVLREAVRILAGGGFLLLLFDVGHPPTAAEPHCLTLERVLDGLHGMRVLRTELSDATFGKAGQRALVVAQRAAGGS